MGEFLLKEYVTLRLINFSHQGTELAVNKCGLMTMVMVWAMSSNRDKVAKSCERALRKERYWFGYNPEKYTVRCIV